MEPHPTDASHGNAEFTHGGAGRRGGVRRQGEGNKGATQLHCCETMFAASAQQRGFCCLFNGAHLPCRREVADKRGIMSTTLRPRPKPGLGAAAIGAEEEALVLDVLRRKELFRYYGADFKPTPPMAAQLEKEFREYIGTDYALAVTSGSGALEVAMAAAGIGPGDEVIVNAWSWIACFTSIVRVGARPVLAEINDTFNLDPREIGRLTTPHTRAVMVIHYQGVAAEMEAIQLEAHKRGLYVIEDCAQSLGTRYRGRHIGTWSDIATYSLQYNKVATSGEGGMVVTRDQRSTSGRCVSTIWATTGLSRGDRAVTGTGLRGRTVSGCRSSPRRWRSRSCARWTRCGSIAGRCRRASCRGWRA